MKTYDIIIASDHAGFDLKKAALEYSAQKNLKTLDLGTYNSSEKVDYPDYAAKVVEALVQGNIAEKAILICNTGIGMSIAANRNSSIRAALCKDVPTAEASRAHNDANILVLAAGSTEKNLAFKIIDRFLSTKFEGGRHSVRLEKIR